MNKFKGHINQVEVSGRLSIATIDILEDIQLKSIIIETPDTASYLQKGKAVTLLFKETEVVLGLNTKQHISIENKLTCKVSKIERGHLLSKVVLSTKAGIITSIISTQALKELDININQDVIAMVKLNEIMLCE